MKSQSTISLTPKRSPPDSFPAQKALEDILLGLSEDDLTQLHELVTSRLSNSSTIRINTTISDIEVANLERLTSRENEVLTLVASGYTRPEVAEALRISRNTAATHVANIYRKLEIESIAEATMLAFRWGIVS